MNQNHAFAYANLALPEDIRQCKELGDFDRALALIHQKLQESLLAEPMRQCLLAQEEIIRRLPDQFPFTKEEGLARVREAIPDFTMAELEGYMTSGRITWRYIKGEPRLIRSFFGTLRKTVPAFAARLPQDEDPAQLSHELKGRSRLDLAAQRMKDEGSMTCHVKMRHTIRVRDEVFVPGETYRVWLPLPAECIQQSNIQVLGTSSQPQSIDRADAPQRTVYWEETMRENHDFWVEYSYDHTAPYCDPLSVKADPVQPDFDTGEQAPHIVFTPYIRALCAELSQGTDDPIEKARRFWEYVTTRVTYSFAPDYFTLDNIAETCLNTRRGDCGIQALAFITLCRCAGIPARWQSGVCTDPDDGVGAHDWAMFYVAPHGWMFADPSFGGGAYRKGNALRHKHYFGNLDIYRTVFNNAFQADFTPASRFWRDDPYDNQMGEVECSVRGLRAREVSRSVELLEFRED